MSAIVLQRPYRAGRKLEAQAVLPGGTAIVSADMDGTSVSKTQVAGTHWFSVGGELPLWGEPGCRVDGRWLFSADRGHHVPAPGRPCLLCASFSVPVGRSGCGEAGRLLPCFASLGQRGHVLGLRFTLP